MDILKAISVYQQAEKLGKAKETAVAADKISAEAKKPVKEEKAKTPAAPAKGKK